MSAEGDPVPFHFDVRVDGLSGAKGRQLNGLAGVCERFENLQHISVWLDGHGEPLIVPRANLVPLGPCHVDYHQERIVVLTAEVKSQHIWEERWLATLTTEDSRMLAVKFLDSASDCPCFQGSLSVLLDGLKYKERGLLPVVLVQLTDLNLAMALNRVAVSDPTLEQLPWGPDWQRLVQFITKHTRQDKRLFLFKYFSHRLHPDRFTSERRGADRLQSVQKGVFHLYPSNAPKCGNYLEVRYSCSSGNRSEAWFDYGHTESTRYIEQAVALDEWHRLSPGVLAQVDPKAFWSAILHYSDVFKTLQEQGADQSLLDEWKELDVGIKIWHKGIRELEGNMELELLPGENGRWSLDNDQQHEYISLRNAHAALLHTWHQGLVDGILPRSAVIEISQDYDGTQLELDVAALNAAHAGGDNEELPRLLKLIALGLPTDSGDVCAKCGTTTPLSRCCRCRCVTYCSRECQVSHYKSHKKVCGKIAGDEKVKAMLCKPSSKASTKPSSVPK